MLGYLERISVASCRVRTQRFDAGIFRRYVELGEEGYVHISCSMHSSSVFVPVVPKLVPSSVFVPSRIGTLARLPSV